MNVKINKNSAKGLLDKSNEFLDGVWIKYFYVPKEGFEITNPSKDHHSHHHH